MTTLYQLSGTALLGTRRSTLELRELPLGLELSWLSPEAQLLAAAGTLNLFEQAGQLPQRFKKQQPAMPKEEHPIITALASRYLAMMLEGTFSDLLPEFFRVMHETTQRLPEEFLPTLLERGKTMYALRDRIKPVLGKTGQWLAEQNPAWGFVLPLNWEIANHAWRSNVMLIRQATVKQARTISPSLGRDLIESTWKSESPTDRTWILKTLRVGLSMDDEPFLETALDDRSHTVRKLASELLSVLPDSRLSKRIAQVARQAFDLGESLEYHPPEMTAQLSRDGVTQPNWADQERVRAMQVTDLMGLVHLSFWPTIPATLIQAALQSSYSAAFVTGLSNAIERQQDSTWAKELLVYSNYTANALKLIPLLETQDIDELIKTFPEVTGPLTNLFPAPRIFGRWSMPWSEAMTHCWSELLHRQAATFPEVKPDSSFEITTKYMSRFCLRSLIAQTHQELTKISSLGYDKLCLESLLILEFRQTMLRSLGVQDV